MSTIKSEQQNRLQALVSKENKPMSTLKIVQTVFLQLRVDKTVKLFRSVDNSKCLQLSQTFIEP